MARRKSNNEADFMNFERALKDAHARFPDHGQFSLLPHESINDVVKRENVPEAKSVYVFFREDDAQRPLYIGKAGTVNQDGTWKDQGLRKRMTMKQDGMYRRDFFRTFINEESKAGLTFHWFVTHDETVRIIPALAELELLQAHFGQFNCLPKLNRCA